VNQRSIAPRLQPVGAVDHRDVDHRAISGERAAALPAHHESRPDPDCPMPIVSYAESEGLAASVACGSFNCSRMFSSPAPVLRSNSRRARCLKLSMSFCEVN
jgi:hypothetical protein